MQFLTVTQPSHVTRLALCLTAFALAVVTVALVSLYPREEWMWEFLVSWPLTAFLCVVTSRLVGTQMLRIHTLNVELQRLVSRDRLTDVATRDFFFSRLAEQPDNYGISLMVDIDHFKKVNDTYGHLTGDEVIAHVAGILAQEVSNRDIVCRFGGEEFVIFLDQATRASALVVAERIRRRVETTPLQADGQPVSVTVSIGGSLEKSAGFIEDAIRQADAALYRAKRLGRNRIVMVDEPPARRSA